MDITKTAYSSSLYYPEIVYNQKHTISANGILTINHNLGYVPYFRIWGELFTGEFSSVWASSAQYEFMFEYFDQGIFGYRVYTSSTVMTIENLNQQRSVYVRMYKNE